MTSILPSPDCGAQQSNCGPAGAELTDQHLDDLSSYISLLGVSDRRDLNDAILWHSGEVDTAQQAYDGMTQSEKDALIVFLKTLN